MSEFHVNFFYLQTVPQNASLRVGTHSTDEGSHKHTFTIIGEWGWDFGILIFSHRNAEKLKK